MSNYVPPDDKADGEIIYGADWNDEKNAVADYINNGNIGNSQITSNPAEKIAESKLALTAATGSHSSRHEPGGADEVNDIDILDTGTLLSAHASRHADGGADPLPAASVSSAMLQQFAVSDGALTGNKDRTAELARQLNLTQRRDTPVKIATLATATSYPRGNGVVRGGYVYFCQANIDAIAKLPAAAMTPETPINLLSGDEPVGMVRIGSDIYFACAGKQTIKKLDSNDVVTPICDLKVSGAAANASLTRIESLIAHPQQAVLYCLAQVSGETRRRIHRIDIASGQTTHAILYGGDSAYRFGDICFVDGETNGASLIAATGFRVSTPGTGDAFLTYSPDDLSTIGSITNWGPNARSYLRDIGNGHVFTIGHANTDRDIIAPFQRKVVASWTLATGTFPGGAAGRPEDVPQAPIFFDGKNINVSWKEQGGSTRAGLVRISPLMLTGTLIAIDPNEQGYITGYATDGTYLFLAKCNLTTGGAKIVRLLL